MSEEEIDLAQCVEVGVMRAFARMRAEHEAREAMQRKPKRWWEPGGWGTYAILAVAAVALAGWASLLRDQLAVSMAKVVELEAAIENASEPEPVPVQRPSASRGIVR